MGFDTLLHDGGPCEEGGKAELVNLIAALQFPVVHLEYRNG